MKNEFSTEIMHDKMLTTFNTAIQPIQEMLRPFFASRTVVITTYFLNDIEVTEIRLISDYTGSGSSGLLTCS